MVQLKIDSAHTTVSFVVRHMGFAKVRGAFEEFEGTIDFDPQDIAAGKATVVIDAKSINTANEYRNNHLRSNDFFGTETNPQITFISTRIEPEDDEEFKIHGDLTMNGVTRPVTLDAEFNGNGVSPAGAEVYAFSASTKVNRKDFNINWNAPIEAGGMLVSDDVKIELEVQANPV